MIRVNPAIRGPGHTQGWSDYILALRVCLIKWCQRDRRTGAKDRRIAGSS